MLHQLKKGLDLPISGLPSQKIVNADLCKKVAVTGFDYNGMKPTMHVQVGDMVKVGQPLFTCKKVEGVIYTSPACGKVVAVNRGDKRVFQSLEIEVDGSDHIDFKNFKEKNIDDYTGEEVEALMVESGMWTALRTRPFSKSPALGSRPKAIFVNAMDTNPLAPDPAIIIQEYEEDFKNGLDALAKICGETLYLVNKAGSVVPSTNNEKISVHEFSGPHPAGTVGVHIHFLEPVHLEKEVWHIGYQDVVALGRLMTTGRLFLERIISLAGPLVFSPRLLRTRLGADLNTITSGQLKDGIAKRVISGSVLNGRTQDEIFHYLGRFHNQVTVIEDGAKREFLGWQLPGFQKFSVKNTYVGKFMNKVFPFDTNLHGSKRAIVPVESFEKVMPMDLLPTLLLKALSTNDTELSQQLGCLELDEEDLALCTFVSPGKEDFGPLLRNHLDIIEKEG